LIYIDIVFQSCTRVSPISSYIMVLCQDFGQPKRENSSLFAC